MTIRVDWDNRTKTVLRYDFGECWDWKEFYFAKREADEMIDAADHPVGVVYDLPKDAILPGDILSRMAQYTPIRHPNACMIVVVGRNAMVKAVYAMVVELFSGDGSIRLANSLEEARMLIAQELHATH